MKKIKSLVAIIAAITLTLSFTACHQKGEIAAKVTDKKSKTTAQLTSAEYLYALTLATMEAQQNITTANSDKETIKDFSKYKVVETNDEGKEVKTEYYKWIDNRKEELLKNLAGVKIQKETLKLELDENQDSTAEYYANMEWQYYYGTTYEKNGVSLETYTDIYKNLNYYKGAYFLSIYDKGGSNPVDEKDITKKFYNNYVLANAITIDIASGESEDESGLTLDQAKDLLKKYKDRLAKGEKFESIYHDYEEKYMAAEDDGHDHSHDEMAVVYGSDETNEASEFFDAINKLSTGDVKILTAEDKSQIILVEKQDIKKDKDQYKAYRESVIYLLKGNEFEADFEDFCKGLKIEYIESATKRLKAEKIDLATEQQ